MKHPIPLWTEANPPTASSSEVFRGPVTALDVRPLLAQGEEPYQAIMEAVAALPPDGVLELTAPFAPVPLYGVLAGIRPSTPVQVVMGRYPATAPLFAEYGFDLCCGGKHSLEFAAKAHGVELAAVLARLQAAAIS